MIKIPHNRAVQLLRERLDELNKPDTDLPALKNRLKDDIERIFGKASTQVFTVIGLDTTNFNKPAEIAKCKKTISQTLKGWIGHIEDFHIIDQEQTEQSEQKYKEMYSDLLKKWNDLVPEYNSLLENSEDTTIKYDEALDEIKMLQAKLNETSDLGKVIKILVLSASPIDENRLRVDEELGDIENGLKLATLRDKFELKSKWAITAKTLQQAMLDEHPTIVPFSGHGDTKGIAIEDSLGNSKPIDNTAIGSLFELFSGSTECVVLNSCYSQSQANEIAKHIPYVIGMRSSVEDKAAIAFSVGFYAALGAGKDIKFAYRMGTVAIKLEGASGSDLPIFLG